MADSPLIPPVGGSNPLPKSRTVPANKGQPKRQQKRPVPGKPKGKNDRPSIDEYA